MQLSRSRLRLLRRLHQGTGSKRCAEKRTAATLSGRRHALFHGITPESEATTHQFRYILHERGRADAAAITEFYRQNDQIINEDRVIFAIQQKALSSSGDGACAADVKTSAIIKADGGLIQARSIIGGMLRGGRAAAGRAARLRG
jgi:hypothetical protein